jgi:hypothetical protein
MEIKITVLKDQIVQQIQMCMTRRRGVKRGWTWDRIFWTSVTCLQTRLNSKCSDISLTNALLREGGGGYHGEADLMSVHGRIRPKAAVP